MNEYISQLKAYRDDGVRPEEFFLQSMLQGSLDHAFAIATPKTLREIQDAWGWMVDNVPGDIRGAWINYERHCKSYETPSA